MKSKVKTVGALVIVLVAVITGSIMATKIVVADNNQIVTDSVVQESEGMAVSSAFLVTRFTETDMETVCIGLTPETKPRTVKVLSVIKSEPFDDAEIIKTVFLGTELTVIGAEVETPNNPWLWVEDKAGLNGYIKMSSFK